MARHDALLHARWRAAVTRRCTCTSAAADAALDEVLARYREPHRRYHGVVHMARVVEAVHELADEPAHTGVDVASVVLAAVYHDAVYDATSTTNEADSAALAARALRSLGASSDTIARVERLILATASVTGPAATGVDVDHENDVAILLDADLAVLGSDPATYRTYARGVREEYAHVDDRAWITGRGRLLDALLARDPLFLTEPGRHRWEARARANLTAERRDLDRSEPR